MPLSSDLLSVGLSQTFRPKQNLQPQAKPVPTFKSLDQTLTHLGQTFTDLTKTFTDQPNPARYRPNLHRFKSSLPCANFAISILNELMEARAKKACLLAFVLLICVGWARAPFLRAAGGCFCFLRSFTFGAALDKKKDLAEGGEEALPSELERCQALTSGGVPTPKATPLGWLSRMRVWMMRL